MFARILFFCAVLLTWAAPARAGELFVTTTTYEITGSCSTMDLASPWTTVADRYVIHSDAVARRHGEHVFVVNRYLGDNVLVLDAGNDYSVVSQWSTGNGSNPHDIAVVAPGRAYVTLYERTELLVVDPLSGATLGSIDLSGLADADGLPEMDQIVVLGDLAFVSLQHVDRPGGWVPAGSSLLAVIDTRTDTLLDVDPDTPEIDGIPLQLQNPFWRMRFDPRLRRIVVLCSGNFLVSDGGVELVNPYTLASEGMLVGESDLGGDLVDVALVSETLGYAIRSDASFVTCLVRFDPSTRALLSTVHCSAGFDLSDLELTGDGMLYLSDRTASNPGVRIFDAASGAALGGPIDVGLPPLDLLPVEAVPTERPPTTPPVAWTLRAWPNPFNPQVQLRLSGDGGTTSDPLLRVLDTRGRQVAVLRGELEASGDWLYRWDGRTADGAAAASGVYRAAVEGPQGPSTSLVLLR